MKIQEWRRLALCSVGLLAAVLLVSLTGMLHPLAGNNLSGEENGTGTASERLQDIAHVEAHGRDENRSAVTQEPRRQYVVVIDAGHGGNDEGTGSTDWKYREKDYALKVADCLKEILDGTDIKAYYTRTDDREVSKEDRVRLAKKVGADALTVMHRIRMRQRRREWRHFIPPERQQRRMDFPVKSWRAICWRVSVKRQADRRER